MTDPLGATLVAGMPAGPPRRGRPRTSGALTCGRCGRATGKIRVTWPDGKVCGTCFHTATRTHGICDRCHQTRLLPGRDGEQRLCRPCAGITTDLSCHRCGAEGEHHRRGLCTRCTLRDDLSALLLPNDAAAGQGGPATAELRRRLVDALAGVDRPESIHTWKRSPAVTALLTGLGNGTIAFTHDSLDNDAFDVVPAGATREHLRQILVHHGLLPHRDPDLARFQAWLAARLATIEDPVVRQPLEQFATWHHLRRVRLRTARAGTTAGQGRVVRGAVHHSKQEITEAGRYLAWLADRGTTLATSTQADLDEYLADGPTTRHTVRTFIVWSRRHHHSPPLVIGFRQPKTSRLITHEQRLRLLGDCLAGTPDSVAYRVAACLLLLYAQPLVRVTQLRTTDVIVSPTGLRIRLGREPAPVPEPFAALLREHLAHRPNLRTAAGSSGSPWLFPGYRAGLPLHPNTIMDRLRDLGIDLLGTRNAALRDLVRAVPAPVVATQLGYSKGVTHRHAALAAQPMARYSALQARRLLDREG